MATNPTYTFGQQAGQAVSPMDSEKHHLVEIIARLGALGGGGAAGGSGSSSLTEMTAGPAQAAVTDGFVPAGKNSISFVTSSDWVGTINGASFPASAAKGYAAPAGFKLPAIAYTRSDGTLYIDFLA